MVVWFNHWFSTAYYFMESLKGRCHIIASNERYNCLYKEIADEFYVEPAIGEGESYIAFCLDFCKTHNVDVFVPRRGMHYIIRNLAQFEELGVKVLCESDEELFNVFDSKYKTASYFEGLKLLSVPQTLLATNLEEFDHAYQRIARTWGTACIKYDTDEGGLSYKKIEDKDYNINRLIENDGLTYSFKFIWECLKTVGTFKPLVVMPYLNGEEVSVDCLGLEGGFVAVPRYKVSSRITRLKQDWDLYEICKKFWEITKMKAPFNIQFRYHNGELYILEVNTRLSGGSWKARYVGVDFIDLAVRNLVGESVVAPDMNFQSKDLAKLEGVLELC